MANNVTEDNTNTDNDRPSGYLEGRASATPTSPAAWRTYGTRDSEWVGEFGAPSPAVAERTSHGVEESPRVTVPGYPPAEWLEGLAGDTSEPASLRAPQGPLRHSEAEPLVGPPVRSAEVLIGDICDRLSEDDLLDASDVLVSVSDAEVILEGTVADRRAKLRAENIARSVSGVREVHNQLEVHKSALAELGSRLVGESEEPTGGYAGGGTRNAPTIRFPD
jgi:hypothetical protein